MVPRYTHWVSRFRQLAALWLVVLLAGGPGIAIVCEAVCVARSAPSESSPGGTTHSAEQHHSATPPARSRDQHGTVPHHHQSGVGAAASSSDSRAGLLGRDCCQQLAGPRPSLTASRGDTDLLPKSHVAILVFGPMFPARDRESAGPTHGPPPGGWSAVRTSLVLRI